MPTKKVGTSFQDDTIATVRTIWEARCRTENPKPFIWKVFDDLIKLAIEYTDLTTGRPKPQQVSRQAYWPCFSDEVDIHQFTDDTALFALMDAWWGMLWAAAPNNECLHANAALTRYTGRGLDQFLGVGWAALIHPDDQERIYKICLNGFRSRRPFRMVYRLKYPDGIYAWIADTAQPRWRPDRRFAGYIGTMHEVATEYDTLPDSLLAAMPQLVNGH
jgi:PAS domain S-box-containing protein